MPGKFIQAIKTCKSANPVIMLDEIDKIGASFQGDPASALLEVLDPEQNRDFLDHYLDVRFDLSNVFFICTANQTRHHPAAPAGPHGGDQACGLHPRGEAEIARRYLIPKQLAAHGLRKEQFTIRRRRCAHHRRLCPRTGRARAGKPHQEDHAQVGAEIVGGKKQCHANRRRTWTTSRQTDLHRRRVLQAPRAGRGPGAGLDQHGRRHASHRGDPCGHGQPGLQADRPAWGAVMVESSEIAYTYVRSFLRGNDAAREFFRKYYVHLHVPAGATPKDGPSAGITMACALYSLAMDSSGPAGSRDDRRADADRPRDADRRAEGKDHRRQAREGQTASFSRQRTARTSMSCRPTSAAGSRRTSCKASRRSVSRQTTWPSAKLHFPRPPGGIRPDPPRLRGRMPSEPKWFRPASTNTAATAYVVQPGETLSGIANQKLGDAARWREIAALNPGVDPDRLKVGQRLVLPKE
jgi:hypothetical protein